MLTVASLPNDITCSYCPGYQHDDVVVVVAAIKTVINDTSSLNVLVSITNVNVSVLPTRMVARGFTMILNTAGSSSNRVSLSQLITNIWSAQQCLQRDSYVGQQYREVRDPMVTMQNGRPPPRSGCPRPPVCLLATGIQVLG